MTNVTFTGGPEIARNLKRMGEAVRKKHLDPALRAGSNVVREEAKREAPQDDGDLKEAIIARKDKKESTAGSTMYKIGVAKRIWYFTMIEYGTSAHVIKVKNKRALAGGGVIYGKKVRVRGQKNPFFRRAWGQSQAKAVLTVISTLKRKLNLS